MATNTERKAVIQFLIESNLIEDVWDKVSLKQAKKAWKYLVGQEVLTSGVILKTHKILMLYQFLHSNEKGHWREHPVWVGGREGMDWKLVPQQMEKLCTEMSQPRNQDEIKQDHVNFEKCHPFIDGNGRVGRLIMNWQRLKNGLPILIIKASARQRYYRWFK